MRIAEFVREQSLMTEDASLATRGSNPGGYQLLEENRLDTAATDAKIESDRQSGTSGAWPVRSETRPSVGILEQEEFSVIGH
jgi:hypothetical protein